MTSTEAPPPEAPAPTVFDYLTEEQITRLLAPINPRRVSVREGMSHLEAYDVRAHLDRMFGFANWDGEVVGSWHLYEEIDGEKVWNPAKKGRGGSTYAGWDDNRKISCGYRVRYRLVIRSPKGRELARYTEEACGDATNFPGAKRADAHDFAVKTAESQALKRAATNLGDQFGLSLYHEGSRDAIVMRTLVGMPTQEKQEGAAPDANVPAVVQETDPQVPNDLNDDGPQGAIDGPTVDQGPRAQKKPRRLKDWADAIETAQTVEVVQQLRREAAAAAMLDADYEGIDIGDRITAKEELIRERSKRPSEREAGPVRQAAEDLERLKATKETTAPDGQPADVVVERDATPSTEAPVPDGDVKEGKVRQSMLAALAEVFGGDVETRDAAIEQVAGKPVGMVGNTALRRILTEQGKVSA